MIASLKSLYLQPMLCHPDLLFTFFCNLLYQIYLSFYNKTGRSIFVWSIYEEFRMRDFGYYACFLSFYIFVWL
uniref:Uncharacterized protein n=1 Tax=Arundo donax TaxID=35708 RepID=A0A0A9G007_ARUDO